MPNGYDIVSLVPDFVAALLGHKPIEEGLPLEGRIPRCQLDFTLVSLEALDEYLLDLHKDVANLPPQQITNIALAAGCYVGEVVRRNARRRFTWFNYGTYFADRQQLTQLFHDCLGTAALLATEGGAITLPINKILRFLYDGPGDATHYYAGLEIKR